MILRRLFAGVLLATATLATVAGAPAQPAPPARVVQIVISSVSFQDPNTTLRIGDIVEWVNKDSFDHTATAKNKAFDVSIPIGKKARVTMKSAGVFDYFCKFHPNMTGAVVVRK